MTRGRRTLPYQHTDECLLWACALDGKQHAMASQLHSHRVELWIMLLLVVCFAVSPGTWPGGAWVPGRALVFRCCFFSMIQILLFVIFTRMSHVSQCKKGSVPIRESCTGFSPLINRWWTNRTRLHGPIGLRPENTDGKQTKTQYTQRPGDLPQMALEQKKSECNFLMPGKLLQPCSLTRWHLKIWKVLMESELPPLERWERRHKPIYELMRN